MEQNRQAYPSDLTDAQWDAVAPIFACLRVYKWPKRDLLNAALYLVETGCKWRSLPHDFPPYSTVHSFYRRARLKGLWDQMLCQLVDKTRKNAGRNPTPSYAIVDSQSVKTVQACDERGFDGGKKN